MKSYIEPLNAADALDVLYAHGIPFGDISYSRDNDEDAVLHGPGGDKVLRTPDDVIAALGDDAARPLATLVDEGEDGIPYGAGVGSNPRGGRRGR